MPKHQTEIEEVCYAVIPNFKSNHNVWLTPDFGNKVVLPADTTITFMVTLKNTGVHPIMFNTDPEFPVRVAASIFQHGELINHQVRIEISGEVLKDSIQLKFKLKTPNQPGSYDWYIGLKSGWVTNRN